MAYVVEEKTWETINPTEIGYYGRPISDLSKDELLDAIVELCMMYEESEKKRKNCCKKVLRDDKLKIL